MLKGTYQNGKNAPVYRVNVLSERDGKRGQLTVVRPGCTPLTHDSPLLESDRDALQWTAVHRDTLTQMQSSVTVDSAVVADGDAFAVMLAIGDEPSVTLPDRFDNHADAINAGQKATSRVSVWLQSQAATLLAGNLDNLLG